MSPLAIPLDQSSDATDMIIMIYKIRIYVIMIKVRRQRELLSRLEEEMELVREQREEVRRDKGRVCGSYKGHLGENEAGKGEKTK